MKVSVFCGTSVDGFLARPDDTFDFLTAGEAVPHGFSEFLNSVDVVVLGRRTFDVVRKLGHFHLYGNKHVVVLSSRRLKLPSIKGVKLEQMCGTPKEIIAALEQRGFKHAYVDGGITIQKFLAAGLVDSITVTRVPVLIGDGIPLFGPVPRDVPLTHVKTNSFPGGMVQSVYDVATARRARTKKSPRVRVRAANAAS